MLDNQIILDALRRAVSRALDRKRRLGQYAVIWKDGAPCILEPDCDDWPSALNTPPLLAPDPPGKDDPPSALD